MTTKGPVREALDGLYAPKKNRPIMTEYSCDIEGLKDGSKRYIYRVDRERIAIRFLRGQADITDFQLRIVFMRLTRCITWVLP